MTKATKHEHAAIEKELHELMTTMGASPSLARSLSSDAAKQAKASSDADVVPVPPETKAFAKRLLRKLIPILDKLEHNLPITSDEKRWLTHITAQYARVVREEKSSQP